MLLFYVEESAMTSFPNSNLIVTDETFCIGQGIKHAESNLWHLCQKWYLGCLNDGICFSRESKR